MLFTEALHKMLKYIQNLYVELPLQLFFYLGFILRTFAIHRKARKTGGYLFNSSLLLPPALQTLRHEPGY